MLDYTDGQTGIPEPCHEELGTLGFGEGPWFCSFLVFLPPSDSLIIHLPVLKMKSL